MLCVCFSPHGTPTVWREKGRWKIILYFVHLYQLFPVKEKDRKTMRKRFCGREKTEAFLWVCTEPLKSVCSSLQAHSSVVCVCVCVCVCACVCTSGSQSAGGCVCVYLCVVWRYAHRPQGSAVPCVHVNVKHINGSQPVCWLTADLFCYSERKLGDTALCW